MLREGRTGGGGNDEVVRNVSAVVGKIREAISMI
jgi:hypothetical protein